MTWLEAREYARRGVRVRRREWGDRWIVGETGLFYLQPVNYLGQDAARRVVQAGDFGPAEFVAVDWTIDPIPRPPDGPALYPIALFFESYGAQDDDVRLRIGGVTVSDTQWNVGWYFNEGFVGPGGNPDYMTSGFRKIRLTREAILNAGAVFEIGSLIEVDIFDGWAGTWKTSPWAIYLDWSDGSSNFSPGGEDQTGSSPYPAPTPAGDYYATGPHFTSHIANGSCTITAPE